MVPSWVWFMALAAALAGFYVWYAVIVARRNKVQEALSSVDVHLNRRHDLVPNVIKLAARFMEHERDLIEEVTRLRGLVGRPHSNAPGEVEARFAVEGQLARRVGQLLVTMEAYPQLKSDATVLEAQRTWTEVEAQITAARRFYNATVNQLNNAIQIFPGSLLAGRSEGVPFALAELRLLDDKKYQVFGGVLASFRLARPRPGLTIVARDRGLLGNLPARTGSGIGRVALEDPGFEGAFEAYGTDQVRARVVLTTTMLERLKQLDELAHARGFTCAFRDHYLMVAFRGMRWRRPPWRLLQPVQAWLPGYRRWLDELIELPARIAATLDLQAPAGGRVEVVGAGGEVFSAPLWRLVGEAGGGFYMIALGAVFGGVAALFGRMGLEEGFAAIGGWYTASLVAAGLAYGAFAISVGLYQLGRLARTWGAPLRGLRLQADGTRRPSQRLWDGLS